MLNPFFRTIARQFIKSTPKVVLCAAFEGETLVLTAWNTEETRILKRVELDPETQARALGALYDAFPSFRLKPEVTR